MYREAREYLNGIVKYGSVLGLDSIKELLKRLGNPQNDLKFIHIAGTNGKGSTLAFVSTILKLAGYKTGRYLSPTVFSYREKIQVNEEYITKEALTKLTFQIKEAILTMLEDGLSHPTIFEVETVLAFLYFKQEQCDIVVLETGLGGVLDATNVVENTIACVLTAISKDHMEYLGDTLSEIAANKAGIIKKDALVITTNQEMEVLKVIEEKCKKYCNELVVADARNVNNSQFKNLQIVFDYKELKQLEINLAGSYQIQNAVLAIETIRALGRIGYPISEEVIRKGLAETSWFGRFSVICKEPLIIIDGAHNEAAAIRLRETIECYFNNKQIMYVVGVLADKDYEKIARITASLASKILTVTTPNNPRALDGEELARVFSKYHSDVSYMITIDEAVKVCMKEGNSYDAIIVFGSLSYLGEFDKQVKAMKGGN
jgi:dihydrofolate synthase/folylpolyglutamate synthase